MAECGMSAFLKLQFSCYFRRKKKKTFWCVNLHGEEKGYAQATEI